MDQEKDGPRKLGFEVLGEDLDWFAADAASAAHVLAESVESEPGIDTAMTDRRIVIRTMKRSELDSIAAIEMLCFEDPWNKRTLDNLNKRVYVAGLTALLDDEIAGYYIYELRDSTIEILRMAVDPEFRNQGVGTAMVERMVSKLYKSRPMLCINVPDTLTGTHLFLSKKHFVGKTLKSDPNTYRFTFQIHPENT
ncbi:MAG: GNAT family N-acetyltransferase [Planctomycetota bacterium]|nr:GNAT family N-acetyltransferase [Planctomycetota bacterium]